MFKLLPSCLYPADSLEYRSTYLIREITTIMPKSFAVAVASIVSSLFLGILPVFAHEGSGAEHLAMGIGIGEGLGLVVGLVLGALSVLVFVKFRNSKSGK